MRLDRFSGRDVGEALALVRAELGDDALVLHTHAQGRGVEILATTHEKLEAYRASLNRPLRRKPTRRSRVIALVGPTGSGKTTTIAKLALNERIFGGGRVGILTLDTLKIGAFEQIQTYADLAQLPLDVLAYTDEVSSALTRLSSCDVILVDTPGRTPNATETELSWRSVLAALEPDEVHLVVPATIRLAVADGYRKQYASLEPTHALLTKLDEVPDPAAAVHIADRLELPARWVTDGQLVPQDLGSAPEKLVDAMVTPRTDELFPGAGH